MLNFRGIAKEAARIAAEKKAEAICVLDIRRQSDIADYFVMATAMSSAQMKAVRDSVVENLTSWGIKPLRVEGRAADRWIAIDYGGLIVHLMQPEAREFYRLEHLFDQAKRVAWENHAPGKRTRAR